MQTCVRPDLGTPQAFALQRHPGCWQCSQERVGRGSAQRGNKGSFNSFGWEEVATSREVQGLSSSMASSEPLLPGPGSCLVSGLTALWPLLPSTWQAAGH